MSLVWPSLALASTSTTWWSPPLATKLLVCPTLRIFGPAGLQYLDLFEELYWIPPVFYCNRSSLLSAYDLLCVDRTYAYLTGRLDDIPILDASFYVYPFDWITNMDSHPLWNAAGALSFHFDRVVHPTDFTIYERSHGRLLQRFNPRVAQSSVPWTPFAPLPKVFVDEEPRQGPCIMLGPMMYQFRPLVQGQPTIATSHVVSKTWPVSSWPYRLDLPPSSMLIALVTFGPWTSGR